MEGVFIFDDIANVEDPVIKHVVARTGTDDLTKALIRESEEIRKKFYRNMPLDDLQKLDESLKTTESFTGYDKKTAQRQILNIVAEMPDYTDTRFENGFYHIEQFEKYLLESRQPEEPYGMFDKDVTMLKFFGSKNGDSILEDIRAKNEAENMGNISIPNTNIQLINYSICPKCEHIYSFKDISDYYLNPKPDPKFKNNMQQYREDTRVFCYECKTYFLPALVIVDGTPKNEVQFLCRIQTMDAIENYYFGKGVQVLSRRATNIVKKDLPGKKSAKNRNKISVTGIKNDVLIKEMEDKPTLISNLIQYTPANLVLNLIDGTNVKNGDLLFGILE